MSEQGVFKQIGRIDAIYTEGSLSLPITVETFKRDGRWGLAVYLDDAIRLHGNASLLNQRDAIAATIMKTVTAEGQLCEVE